MPAVSFRARSMSLPSARGAIGARARATCGSIPLAVPDSPKAWNSCLVFDDPAVAIVGIPFGVQCFKLAYLALVAALPEVPEEERPWPGRPSPPRTCAGSPRR